MITIDRIETVLVDLPAIRPHKLAMTTVNVQSIVLIRLFRSDGVIGIGEATTIGGLAYGDESPEGIKLAIDTYFSPIMIGQNADRPAEIMAAFDRHIVGNRFAKNGLETALLDGLGKACVLPVSELLGGRRRDALPVAWTLASGSTDRDIDEGVEMLEACRHNIFKLKIGMGDVDEDCRHVEAIAKALGGRSSIRVDVNQHWSRAEATRGVAWLDSLGVDLIEQPLLGTDIEGMTALSCTAKAAIMADEALTGPQSAYRYAQAQAADVFSVKIAQSGGLTKAGKVADVGDVAHVALYGGTMLEAGVGTVASAHVFSTFKKLEWGTELFGPLLLTEDILSDPLTYCDFSLAVPDGPGLGINLDEDKVRHFARTN